MGLNLRREKTFVLHVDDASIVAGGTIRGSVVLDTKLSGEIRVSLVRSVDSRGGVYMGSPNHSNVVVASTIINPTRSSGSALFDLVVPEDAEPGFTTTSSASASPTIERSWKVVAECGHYLAGSREVPVEVVTDSAIAPPEPQWRSAEPTARPHPSYESPLPAMVACLVGLLLALAAPFAADTGGVVGFLAIGLVAVGIGIYRLRSTLRPHLSMWGNGSPVLEVGADVLNRGGNVPVRASVQKGHWEVRLVGVERYAERTAGRGGPVTHWSSRELAVVRQPLQPGPGLRDVELPVSKAAHPTSLWGSVEISWTVTVVPRGAAPWYIGRLALPVDVV